MKFHKLVLLMLPILILTMACGTGFKQPVSSSSAAPTSSLASSLTPSPDNTRPTVGLQVVHASNQVTGTFIGKTCHIQGKLPDSKCTPGSISDAVTEQNFHSTICVSGYTTTVRPDSASTSQVKTRAMVAYGEPASVRDTTELDHLIPLELGGSNDASNLWPQPSDLPGSGFVNTKDDVENKLHAAVCADKVSLTAAQIVLISDWTTALAKLGV